MNKESEEKKMKSPLIQMEDEASFFGDDNTASTMECTGLIPTPPTDEAEAESYADLYTIPKPEKDQKGPSAKQ